MEELEKDGSVAGLMLLSVIPVAFIGIIPYFGDVISGFNPILYIGGFIVYYRKMLPSNGDIYMKISIRLLIAVVVVSVSARVLDLAEAGDAVFILRILSGMILITFPIGWLISHMVMALFYYGIITPIAVIFRITGRDPLRRKYDPQADTYWIPYKHKRSSKDYFHQF